MKSLKTTLLFSLLSISSFAQDTFQFKGTLAPNSIYMMKMNSDLELKMQIDAPIEIEGIEKETTSHTLSTFDIQTQSFHQLPNKDVPFEVTYTNIDMNLKMNNQPIPYNSDELKGLYEVKLKGISNDKGREKFEYVGPAQYKVVFSGILKSFESLTKYPTETFTIDQSHSLPFSTDIPLENGKNYVMDFVVKYTLKNLENDWAYFDVLLFSDQKKQNLDGLVISIDTYKVMGQMKVSVKDNNMYDSSFEGPMKMTMEKDGLTIKMDYTYKYKLNSTKK